MLRGLNDGRRKRQIPRFQASQAVADPVVKKAVFRSSRKWMKPMSGKFSTLLVSPVYLRTTVANLKVNSYRERYRKASAPIFSIVVLGNPWMR
jgi:hypothetical protein